MLPRVQWTLDRGCTAMPEVSAAVLGSIFFRQSDFADPDSPAHSSRGSSRAVLGLL